MGFSMTSSTAKPAMVLVSATMVTQMTGTAVFLLWRRISSQHVEAAHIRQEEVQRDRVEVVALEESDGLLTGPRSLTL